MREIERGDVSIPPEKETLNNPNVIDGRREFTDKISKRATRKLYSSVIVRELQAYNPFSPLMKAYKNTESCASVLLRDENGKFTSKYCKNRFCLTCASIMSAKLMNTYSEEIDQFEECVLLTLTMQTVDARGLSERIDLMNSIWRKITKRREIARMLKGGLKGIIKLECTYRPDNKRHPHFHLILNSVEAAKKISNLWKEYVQELGFWGGKRNLVLGEDLIILDPEAENRDKRKLEIFKYVTKLISVGRQKDGAKIDYKALDQIYQALSGRQLYRAFGKWNKTCKEEFEDNDLEATLEDSELIEKCYLYHKGAYEGVVTQERIDSIPNKKLDRVLNPKTIAFVRKASAKDYSRYKQEEIIQESQEVEDKIVLPLEMQEIKPNYGFLSESLEKPPLPSACRIVVVQGELFIDSEDSGGFLSDKIGDIPRNFEYTKSQSYGKEHI